MFRFYPLLLAIAICLSQYAAAQPAMEKPQLLSPLLEQYDLHYVKLDVHMNNTSTQVAGKATLQVKVLAPLLHQFAFELDSLLTIDSVQIEGINVLVTRSGSLVTTDLTAPFTTGQNITAEIYYHGATPSGTGFFTRGLIVDPDFHGHSITFSLSDRFLAKDWWPTKQDLTDKIDSADLWITVSDSMQVASNGSLKNTTAVAPGYHRFEWQTRYPTAYYLLSVAIMPYQVYETQAYFGGDSMQVQHFLPDAPGFLADIQPELDSVSLVISYFSELFGRYPFWQEKYGQAFAPLGGGMEHQTISTIGPHSSSLMAHELCHQWWGDAVTAKSWADIWLSEGFASYGEHLFIAHFQSTALAKSWRQQLINSITSMPGGSVFVDDTTSDGRVFDGRLTYNKGAMVVHMLRQRINNDSLFFSGLRAYLSAHENGNGTTADLKSALEVTTGLNLDTFFNQWIYGEGYPRYNIRWNQADDLVYVELTQQGSMPASISFFPTPVELLLKSPAGDTTVLLYHNEPVQLYAIAWDKSMTGLQLNPDYHLVCRLISNLHQPSLGITTNHTGSLKLTNNPTATHWELSGLKSPATLVLRQLNGQVMYLLRTVEERIQLPADSLPAGPYLLEIRETNKVPVHFRLIKS